MPGDTSRNGGSGPDFGTEIEHVTVLWSKYSTASKGARSPTNKLWCVSLDFVDENISKWFSAFGHVVMFCIAGYDAA